MLRRAVPLLFALGCLTAAPLLAQESAPAAAPAPASATSAGPRLQSGFATYRPALAEHATSSAAASAAAADRTIITISTLGLVLLIVLLVILIA